MSEPKSIAVIGVGGIGGVLAAVADSCGHRVTLCVRSPLDRLEVEGELGNGPVRAAIATSPAELEQVDWVFLATKTQDSPAAKPWLDALAGPGTTVLALQNGVNHRARLEPLVATGVEILPALVYVNGEVVSRGRVHHRAGNRMVVPAGDRAELLAALLSPPMEVVPVDDFLTEAWSKMLGNLAASPITALTGKRLGVLFEPGVEELALQLIQEAVQVGRADGAALGEDTGRETFDVFRRFGPETATSMYQDRLAGRPLEFEALTGYVVERGHDLGVSTPAHEVVLALLRGAGGADA